MTDSTRLAQNEEEAERAEDPLHSLIDTVVISVVEKLPCSILIEPIDSFNSNFELLITGVTVILEADH